MSDFKTRENRSLLYSIYKVVVSVVSMSSCSASSLQVIPMNLYILIISSFRGTFNYLHMANITDYILIMLKIVLLLDKPLDPQGYNFA